MIGLGTIQSGGRFCQYPAEREEWKRVLRLALRSGITTFDTAYSYQDAEALLSSVIREQHIEREQLEIIDKVMPIESMKEKAETSLKRLGFDYIDYLLLHWPAEDRQLFRSLKVLEKLKSEEKAIHIGVSNFPLQLLSEVSEDFEVEALENPVSLIWTRELDETVRFCNKHNMKFFGYGPLGFGILTGRMRGMWCEGTAELSELMAEISRIAAEHAVSEAVIALSWSEAAGADTIFTGASTTAQLEELLNRVILTSEEQTTLRTLADKVTALNNSDNPYCHAWKKGAK